jgi:hypothetical protein
LVTLYNYRLVTIFLQNSKSAGSENKWSEVLSSSSLILTNRCKVPTQDNGNIYETTKS